MGGRSKVVMDLSDPHFRKTFAHSNNLTKERSRREEKEEKLQPPTNIYLPNKRGRFDH